MTARPVPTRRPPADAVAGLAHLDLARPVPTVVVDASCWLDLATAPAVRAVVDAGLERRPPVLAVDLSSCHLADGYGLGMLAEASRQAARQGTELVLVGVSRRIGRVLALTGLDAVLPVTADARTDA